MFFDLVAQSIKGSIDPDINSFVSDFFAVLILFDPIFQGESKKH